MLGLPSCPPLTAHRMGIELVALRLGCASPRYLGRVGDLKETALALHEHNVLRSKDIPNSKGALRFLATQPCPQFPPLT